MTAWAAQQAMTVWLIFKNLFNMKQTVLLILAFVCALLGVQRAEAKIYLVAVGVSDYPGTANDLTLPANDAKTTAWLYSKNTKVKYSLLLNEQATQKRIKAAMKKVYGEAKANDIVVFFFSGHGYPGGFVAYDGMLDYSVVRDGMANNKCKNKMIFADACFAGKIRTNNNGHSSVSAAKKANVMLFLSSRGNETSLEKPGMKNGFFTTYLVKGLRGGADKNRDRTITAKELFNYVHSGVIQLSGNRQHPVMWGKFANNMPVMKW